MRVTPSALLLAAAFLLLSGTVTVPLAIFTAAACHELAHCVVLRALHAPPKTLVLSALGASLYVPGLTGLSYGGEALAVAAGPVCNLLLWAGLSLTGIEALAVFSGANLMLGALNLLPVRPMDGGHLLWLAAALVWDPYRADRLAAVTGALFAATLLGLCLYLTASTGGGLFLLPGALWLVAQSLPGREKGLAKSHENGYNETLQKYEG